MSWQSFGWTMSLAKWIMSKTWFSTLFPSGWILYSPPYLDQSYWGQGTDFLPSNNQIHYHLTALNRGFLYTKWKKKIQRALAGKISNFILLFEPRQLSRVSRPYLFRRLMYLALHLLKLRNHLSLARLQHHCSAVEAQNASATLPQAFSCVLQEIFV